MQFGPNGTMEMTLDEMTDETTLKDGKEFVVIRKDFLLLMREDMSYLAGKLEGVELILTHLKELKETL